MGNVENHRDSHLKLTIETEKALYNSGNTIVGVVTVTASKSRPYDALYLRLEGKERTRWQEGSSKNMMVYEANFGFYNHESILCRFKKGIPSGRYAYPFALNIPLSLPGSYQDDLREASISYNLMAYLASFTVIESKCSQSMSLTIREPFRRKIRPIKAQHSSIPRNWCCLELGRVGLEARFSSTSILTQKMSLSKEKRLS